MEISNLQQQFRMFYKETNDLIKTNNQLRKEEIIKMDHIQLRVHSMEEQFVNCNKFNLLNRTFDRLSPKSIFRTQKYQCSEGVKSFYRTSEKNNQDKFIRKPTETQGEAQNLQKN